jgi:hypothetical protein
MMIATEKGNLFREVGNFIYFFSLMVMTVAPNDD